MDPDMGLRHSFVPGVTMILGGSTASVAAGLWSTYLATRGNLVTGHPRGLWWQHGLRMSTQTLQQDYTILF